MKKILLLLGAFCFGSLHAQTVLFSDDFETGTATSWTLNGGSGDNQWIVNNAYTGFNPLIINTPNQPGGITGGPNSYYLHIHNVTVASTLSVFNSNFDTGSSSNQNATMASPISTVGMTNTTISFWYLCAGFTGTVQGKLQYSTNGGTSWTDAGTYVNVSAWTQETVSLPVFDNQTSLLFRFNWQNSGANGSDPAFSVDEVEITANGSSSSISNVVSSDTAWCFNAGETFNVTFDASGTFYAGNTFSAELSDALGSFAAPTVIGTLNSTSNGSLSIACTLPMGTSVGNSYAIRVSSSDPAFTSTDIAVSNEVEPIPNVNAGQDTTVCVGSTLTLAGDGASTYTWDNGITDNVPFTPIQGTTIFTVTGTSTGGCIATDQVAVTAEQCAGIEEYVSSAQLSIYPNPTNDYFTIKGVEGIVAVKILDLSGRVVHSYAINKNGKYSVSAISQGTYFVTISNNKGTFAKKIKIK